MPRNLPKPGFGFRSDPVSSPTRPCFIGFPILLLAVWWHWSNVPLKQQDAIQPFLLDVMKPASPARNSQIPNAEQPSHRLLPEARGVLFGPADLHDECRFEPHRWSFRLAELSAVRPCGRIDGAVQNPSRLQVSPIPALAPATPSSIEPSNRSAAAFIGVPGSTNNSKSHGFRTTWRPERPPSRTRWRSS